jgi:hypothetical protein
MASTGNRAGVVDHEVEHLLPLRPVDIAALLRVLLVGLGRSGQGGRIEAERRTGDHGERADAFGIFQRHALRKHAAHRHAGDMRPGDAMVVEHAHGVAHHVLERVGRRARRIFRRQAGVAVVVADNEVATRGKLPAEGFRPPQHRGHGAHDQKDRRIFRTAEAFRNDVGALRRVGHLLLLSDCILQSVAR